MKIFNVLRKRITASAQPCQSASSLPRHSLRMLFALSILLALLAACGDESSSSAPDPIGEISSSSNDDNGSTGKDKDTSLSSQKDSQKSSSSVAEKNSSSSVSGKNSSSSVAESSSSEEEFHLCENGDTLTTESSKKIMHFVCENNNWVVEYTVRKDSLDSLAAIEKNKEHPNMDSLFAGYDGEYFEFEDPRDNRKYKYVEYIWHSEDGKGRDTFYVMAENLNYGKMISSGTTKFDDKVTEKLCYVDDEWFCDNHFGGLYTWAEAMNLPKVCDSVAVDSNDACKSFANAVKSVSDPRVVRWQGICPDGWHIMTQYEWQHTETSAGLKSKAVWEHKGYNSSGMSIIPTDRLETSVYTAFWMPTALESNVAKAVFFYSTSNNADLSGAEITRRTFRSIRCVMDANNTLIH
ncbi:FISUMP domain-containing protein [Fibrobacter sp. UWH4]|uniref:FISUMP domain-containing protein n=1 Tax=Fibrobacter sp. UWH4 TaxID=1896210 RepID=UPI0009140268|nr:FISUMP domain-containing protein [Fibrobacter sp. UWH4]SHL52550.1 major paralogous domain-containing protein [Fibrobacter sp. UWH4]